MTPEAPRTTTIGVYEIELQQTVERARGHDPDAWEALYRHAYARLHAYARRRLPSNEHADDAVSEVFTRAMDAIDRFRWSDAGVDGWLFGVLRNVLFEQYRRERRYVGEVAAGEAHEPVDEEPAALDRLLESERADAVRRALDQLPAKEREMLELRIVGGLDAPAVAAAVGKRPGAVRMAQSRALGRLQNLLGVDFT